MLSIINNRLRLIFPDNSDQAFSSLNMLLYRDFFQLLLVNSCLLYTTRVTGLIATKGQGLYRSFNRTIQLTQAMQQQSEDKTTIRFRTALGKLRELKLSELSQQLLCTCIQNQLLPNEVAQFQLALRLYFTNEKVCERNYSQLAAANRPVKRILSKHTSCNASKASDKEANNLLTELLVCISAQVMLTTNLQTEKRLVNGSIRTITDILQNISQDLSVSMLSLLLVRFNEYSGLDFPLYKSKIVLIFPVTC